MSSDCTSVTLSGQRENGPLWTVYIGRCVVTPCTRGSPFGHRPFRRHSVLPPSICASECSATPGYVDRCQSLPDGQWHVHQPFPRTARRDAPRGGRAPRHRRPGRGRPHTNAHTDPTTAERAGRPAGHRHHAGLGHPVLEPVHGRLLPGGPLRDQLPPGVQRRLLVAGGRQRHHRHDHLQHRGHRPVHVLGPRRRRRRSRVGLVQLDHRGHPGRHLRGHHATDSTHRPAGHRGDHRRCRAVLEPVHR